jgi:hypothetical protein
MDLDQFHHQKHVETKRLADHVCASCNLDPHSRLAGAVRDLQTSDLISVIYLMSHVGFPLEFALMHYTQVTAIRMPRKPSARRSVVNAHMTCQLLSYCTPDKRIHIDGIEWNIIDNRCGLLSISATCFQSEQHT